MHLARPLREMDVAKVKFSLHAIAKDIEKAQKKLRAMRAEVAPADKKKIDLNLRVLDKSLRLIKSQCPRPLTRHPIPFGQTFTTIPK